MTPKSRIALTMELQRPDMPKKTCRHCGKETVIHHFTANGVKIETHYCKVHGGVVPLDSLIELHEEVKP